jgi:hypothetical protein
MGELLIGSGTKGFTALNSLALSNSQNIDTSSGDKGSPALGKLLDLLKESSSSDGEPTEVMILIRGKEERAFTFVLKDPTELIEVLQWTVGRE